MRFVSGEVYYRHDYNSDPMIVEVPDIASFVGTRSRAYSDQATESDKRWSFTDYVSDDQHVYYRGPVLEGLVPARTTFLRDEHDDGSTIEDLAYQEISRRDDF